MYTIYTSPGCGPCMAVKAHLRAHKIPHTLVDVSQDPAAVEKLRKMGYFRAPVTVDEATGEHWHGYLPDRYASPAPEAAPAADMQATIDLGPVEAGEHVLWDPHQGHLLIIGDRDSGKSVIQRGIMETAVSVGWQAWGLGLPGELDKVEDHRYAQVVTADVSDQLERIRAASELMRERYHLDEEGVFDGLGYLENLWINEDLWAEDGSPVDPETGSARGVAGPVSGSTAGEHEADVAENLLLGIHRLGRSVGIHLSVSCHGIAHHLGQSLAADLRGHRGLHLPMAHRPARGA
uniref:Glutaredoxin/FtsK/SpoIIIE family n=1 Tax=Micrococcus sp. MG-2010-D12 TaxID=936902 RepID=A0A0F6YRY4_9MICC|nr:glutaredoxin domain-containing protein [Micrococcus sp. MG-2010-D12]AKF15814.1 glutaredoxin/FtsK/SpoIIIE family [Micrococcus sp. MG-2010-D12]